MFFNNFLYTLVSTISVVSEGSIELVLEIIYWEFLASIILIN